MPVLRGAGRTRHGRVLRGRWPSAGEGKGGQHGQARVRGAESAAHSVESVGHRPSSQGLRPGWLQRQPSSAILS